MDELWGGWFECIRGILSSFDIRRWCGSLILCVIKLLVFVGAYRMLISAEFTIKTMTDGRDGHDMTTLTKIVCE